MVFSLGNSFRTVPLNQVISLETLLQPMVPRPDATAADVIRHLMNESTHPPVYFVLAHWWMQLFPPDSEGFLSLWVARSLPAVFGVLAIPATFGLAWLVFGSCLVAHCAAAMMALSPYGVYLSQEARHYTLAALVVIASLACLVLALRHLQRRSPIPLWFCLGWVGINSLGVAVHYLFSLTLLAETLALLGLWLLPWKTVRAKLTRLPQAAQQLGSNFWRLGAIALGTFLGGLVWLPEVTRSHGSDLTEWIRFDWDYPLSFINPFFQLLASWVTMVVLLPIEGSNWFRIVPFLLVMLAYIFWATPRLVRLFRINWQWSSPPSTQSSRLLAGFVLATILLLLAGSYLLGKDLTRGARYNFVYFPAVMVLLGACLAIAWQFPLQRAPDPFRSPPPATSGQRFVVIVLTVALLSGLSVVANFGYQKYYRPELLAPVIQQQSQAPVLIATSHETHVQTGELMGLAREFLRLETTPKQRPRFLLAHFDRDRRLAQTTLTQVLAQTPRPLDLWTVNFKTVGKSLTVPADCAAQMTPPGWVNGYSYQLYRCRDGS